MKMMGARLTHAIWLGFLAAAVMPLLMMPAYSESYSFPEPDCPTVKRYAQKVDLHDLSNLVQKDAKNISAALKIIPQLAQLSSIYIDNDYNDIYTKKADISPRTVIFPHESCPSGCTGYIVNDAEHGFSSIPFYYRHNVFVEPSGFLDGQIEDGRYGGLVLLDLDRRNIISLQRRDKKQSDSSTIVISPASQAGTYSKKQQKYLTCLEGGPLE